MNIEDLSPDQAVFWEWGFVRLNYTIVYDEQRYLQTLRNRNSPIIISWKPLD